MYLGQALIEFDRLTRKRALYTVCQKERTCPPISLEIVFIFFNNLFEFGIYLFLKKSIFFKKIFQFFSQEHSLNLSSFFIIF